jgi:magnesium transporter
MARSSLADNEDMRKISAYAGIIAVPTAIAGIYGMNFRYMPELDWRFGYPLVLLIIGISCVLLYRGFKRNGWL